MSTLPIQPSIQERLFNLGIRQILFVESNKPYRFAAVQASKSLEGIASYFHASGQTIIDMIRHRRLSNVLIVSSLDLEIRGVGFRVASEAYEHHLPAIVIHETQTVSPVSTRLSPAFDISRQVIREGKSNYQTWLRALQAFTDEAERNASVWKNVMAIWRCHRIISREATVVLKTMLADDIRMRNNCLTTT